MNDDDTGNGTDLGFALMLALFVIAVAVVVFVGGSLAWLG